MDPTRLMRGLLIVMWATGLAAGAMEFALESTLPEPLREYVEDSLDADPTPAGIAGMGLALAAVALFVWATVLLWQMDPRGARVLLTSFVLILLATPLLGPAVSTPWGQLLNEVSTATGGAILAWVYFRRVPFRPASPDEPGFERNVPPPPPPRVTGA